MSKSLLKSRFWQILLYCKAFSLFCGKCQAAAAIWQFAACHKNVYGTRNLTPGECRVKVPAPFPFSFPVSVRSAFRAYGKRTGQQKSAIHAIFMENLPRQENREHTLEQGHNTSVYIFMCVLGSVL